jgi:hypothetical protein
MPQPLKYTAIEDNRSLPVAANIVFVSMPTHMDVSRDLIPFLDQEFGDHYVLLDPAQHAANYASAVEGFIEQYPLQDVTVVDAKRMIVSYRMVDDEGYILKKRLRASVHLVRLLPPELMLPQGQA